MIGFAEPTQDQTWTGSVYVVTGPTATTTAFDVYPRHRNEPYVIVIESRHTGNDLDLTKWSDVLGNESVPQRRRRLSLEAIKRFVALARRSRLHVQSVWSRVVHVARVCAQSERWRVLAS